MRRGVDDEWSESAEVGNRFDADVMAMEIAVSMDDSFALSMRVKVSRCVCASTMAMLIGTPSSVAYNKAACRARDAPLWVSVGSDTTAVEVFVIFPAWVRGWGWVRKGLTSRSGCAQTRS